MIFYFSGTGNSQLAARQVAKITGDETVFINPLLREERACSFRSEHPLVFVAPTYAWQLPRVVEQWICRTRFEGSRDAYFILTCGAGCGNAAAYAERLCAEEGMRFRGLAPVIMPENYLAMFPTPSETESRTIIERAKPQIAALAEKIQRGEPFGQRPSSPGGRLLSGPVNRLYYPLFVHDKGFTVSDRCVSCKKCAQRCPLGNIIMVDGKPRWQGNCTHCMACIGGCPTEAIEYKSTSKGRRRHYIMEE